MTLKEAEHWLIENDFRYINDGHYWAYKGNRPQVSDQFLQDHPATAIKWIKDELGD